MSLSILHDFSEYTGLRYCSISENSGEEFYHEILNKAFYDAISNDVKLTIDLDNTAGYSPSFIDEAFGNLIYDFSLELVKNNLVIISLQEPHWLEMLTNETYKLWEERRQKKSFPKITKDHNAWYRRTAEGKFECKKWLYI